MLSQSSCRGDGCLFAQAGIVATAADGDCSSRPGASAWEGDPEGLHSLAIVNRALCGALLDRGHDLGLIWDSNFTDKTAPNRRPLDARLAERLGRGPIAGPPEVHVGHRWPPQARTTAAGRWVLMQPWEYGSLPKTWLGGLRQVDEIWAYSRSVRDCYLEAGVAGASRSFRLACNRRYSGLGLSRWCCSLVRSSDSLCRAHLRKEIDVLLAASAGL